MQTALDQHRVGRVVETHAVAPDSDVYTFTSEDGSILQFYVSGDAPEGYGVTEYRCNGLEMRPGLIHPACMTVGGTGCQPYGRCC
jgi:hypothetical protein